MGGSSTIWRRRIVLMAIVGLVVALPVTLAIRDGDGDTDEPGGAASGPGAAFELPPVGPGVRDRGLEVGYRVPRGWSEDRVASAVRLRSGDETAEVVIAAPAAADAADAVLDDALASIRRGYDDVEVSPGSGRKVGGLEAEGAVVSASAAGVPLRIVVAVAAGRERAYLVQVFTTDAVSPQSLREAQVALNSLELNG